MPKKPKTVSVLKKQLDAIFSKYLRTYYADDTGMVECYTCKSMHRIESMHAGHFCSRRWLSVRWDFLNVMPQCVKCNIFDSGQQWLFAERLNTDFGRGTAEAIMEKSKQTVKMSRSDYEELIEDYTEKYNNLTNR